VGGLLAVSGFRPTHLAGSNKTTVGHNPTIVRELTGTSSGTGLSGKRENAN
jgi:hypothetical protein